MPDTDGRHPHVFCPSTGMGSFANMSTPGDFQVCDSLPRHTRTPVYMRSRWRRRQASTASSGGLTSGDADAILASKSLECTSDVGVV